MKTNKEKSHRHNRNFLAAAMHVIGPVAEFGEDLCASLFRGKVVSNEEEYGQFADVFVKKSNLAVQVKMCNCNHAHRPTIEQISTLYQERQSVGFVVQVNEGVYALVFYRGCYQNKKHGVGKSKFLNRKYSLLKKRQILAEELQYMYILDVRVMQRLVTSPDFRYLLWSHKVKLWHEDRLNSSFNRRVLNLNRTFLRGFLEKELAPNYKKLLDESCRRNNWIVTERLVPMRFITSQKVVHYRTIPVRLVGTKSTVKIVSESIPSRHSVAMRLPKDGGAVLL